MALSPDDRRRFARQLSLGEIGEEGQARLRRTRAGLPEDCDRGAAAIAEAYILRAGMTLVPPHEADVVAPVPTPAGLGVTAGDPMLLEAARSLTGALAAVEAIKRALGLATDVPPEPPALVAPRGE